MTTRIKLRRDNESNWSSANPVLALGEPGYDTTNNKLKIGDGVTSWNSLDYLTDETGGSNVNIGNFKFFENYLGTTDNPDTGNWGGYDMTLSPNGEGNAWVSIPRNNSVAAGSPTEIGNSGDGGVRIVTNRGGLNIGGNIEAPGDSTHFHIAFDASNMVTPTAHLYLGDDYNYFKVESGRNGVTIGTNDTVSTSGLWRFRADGNADFPGGLQFQPTGLIFQNGTFINSVYPYINNGSAVIWTANQTYITSAKLTIQVEVSEQGDNSGWHTQVCEALIAARGSSEPVMTVYANTYTSTQPLVTFSVRRNLSGYIEVVGTSTPAANGNPSLRIYSVEMMTKD